MTAGEAHGRVVRASPTCRPARRRHVGEGSRPLKPRAADRAGVRRGGDTALPGQKGSAESGETCPTPPGTAGVSPASSGAVIGYAAIAWLLNWLRSRSLTVFVVYRLLLGALILATVFLRG